jgi:hypothetical protein
MKLVMRSNQSRLGPTQKAQFAQLVLDLKAYEGTYDEFVAGHRDTVHIDPRTGNDLNDAHRGPAFFPWHREYLRRLETWLQYVANDPLLGLPYWDWSVDNDPNDLSFWGPLFMGGNGRTSDGKVMDGPFAYDARKDGDPKKWVLNVRTPGEAPYLRRQLGSDPLARSLPRPADVQAALQATPYDVAPFDDSSTSGFRNMVEGWIPGPGPQMHNRVHVYVGGSMEPMTSPNDPVFFLHHCFVDKLWADWQAMHKNDVGYQPYLPTQGARKGHNLYDYMPPWDTQEQHVRPVDVLDHRKLGYRYDTEDYLLPGEELYIGQWIWSADKQYYLLYGDQERVLWLQQTSGDRATRWQSATTNQPPGRCIMRDDGNLVIYHIDAQGRGNPYEPNPIWESKTSGDPGGYLVVNNQGYLVLYEHGGASYYWYRPS